MKEPTKEYQMSSLTDFTLDRFIKIVENTILSSEIDKHMKPTIIEGLLEKYKMEVNDTIGSLFELYTT